MSNIKYMKYMNHLITLAFCASVLVMMNMLLSQSLDDKLPTVQEGFTTYFRQTIRPHVRRIGHVKESVYYHFNKRFGEFGKGLGIF
jgi:hypothetical protein